MSTSDIRPAKDFTPASIGRISPAQRMVDELDGKFYTIAQTAEICGVSLATVRRLLRSEKVKAPSDVLVRGGMHIWLLTEADLVEVARFFNATRAVDRHLRAKYDGEPPLAVTEMLKEQQ